MAPLPEKSGALPVLRDAMATTRAARRTWGYFWLRVSAAMLGLSGLLIPWVAKRLGAPEVGYVMVLPILIYSAFALSLGGALELIRRPSQKEGRRWFLFFFLFMGLTMLAVELAPTVAKLLPPGARDLVPLFILLVGMPLLNQLTRKKNQAKASAPQAPKDQEPSRWSAEVLGPRVLGLTFALFLLTLVGALPGFIGATLQGARFSEPPGGAPVTVHVALFTLLLALVLGVHAAVAERLWPRWPRLMLCVLIFAPYAIALFVPGFPNCIDLFVGYLGWLEGRLAPPFWSV